jgi:hypothetical protein
VAALHRATGGLLGGTTVSSVAKALDAIESARVMSIPAKQQSQNMWSLCMNLPPL